MKRAIGESREHHSHRLFMSRSSTMFRSLRERHEKAGIPPIKETLEEFRVWLRVFIGKPCEYCGKKLTVKECSIDHPTPLSRGGGDGIEVICSGCNKAKGFWTRKEYNNLLYHLNVLDDLHPEGKMKMHVLRSLKIANSFRFGSDRRAKESSTDSA